MTMIGDVSFREASTQEDLEAVWKMWKVIMDQKIYYPYDDSYSRELIEDEWINATRNTVIVANYCAAGSPSAAAAGNNNNSTTIVGAYIIKANQPGYGKHVANAAYMVATSCRGKGLGNALCRHSLEVARQRGYRALQFNLVVSTNAAAIRIWKKHGFQIVGTIPGGFYHVEKGYVDAFIFYKSLLNTDLSDGDSRG